MSCCSCVVCSLHAPLTRRSVEDTHEAVCVPEVARIPEPVLSPPQVAEPRNTENGGLGREGEEGVKGRKELEGSDTTGLKTTAFKWKDVPMQYNSSDTLFVGSKYYFLCTPACTPFARHFSWVSRCMFVFLERILRPRLSLFCNAACVAYLYLFCLCAILGSFWHQFTV